MVGVKRQSHTTLPDHITLERIAAEAFLHASHL